VKTHKTIPKEILGFLTQTDTCTVSNAIETFSVRLRNEGFAHRAIRSLFPDLPPVAGYAVTGRIKTTSPPMTGACYYNRTDWWEHMARMPEPRIIVFEDTDRVPGTGALFGEIHARIAKALGCVAFVTTGTVRDVAAVKGTGFACFGRGVSVSHSYAHVVDFGERVEIGGMPVSPGDLLHCDRHGVLSVPIEIAAQLPARIESILAHERKLIELCDSPEFSLDKLVATLKESVESCPLPVRD
jgi:regulator of RNase E activity RraA